jgi:mono/diheme cytochrome c family protein
MRTLIAIGLLIPFAGFAQDKNQGTKKFEITYSLSGQDMYRSFCASCHGTDGKGNGPAAAALKKAPADLTLLSKKNGGKFPAERVRAYVEGTDAKTIEAHGSREMPIWGDVFRQIADDPGAVRYRLFTLSSYLESLQVK